MITEPDVADRLRKYEGRSMNDYRKPTNPNITAREACDLANYIKALRDERDAAIARAEAAETERDAARTALRIAREGYASEEVTGLPVLPQWRARVLAMIDAHLSAKEKGR
jgi:hypothetical protein